MLSGVLWPQSFISNLANFIMTLGCTLLCPGFAGQRIGLGERGRRLSSVGHEVAKGSYVGDGLKPSSQKEIRGTFRYRL